MFRSLPIIAPGTSEEEVRMILYNIARKDRETRRLNLEALDMLACAADVSELIPIAYDISSFMKKELALRGKANKTSEEIKEHQSLVSVLNKLHAFRTVENRVMWVSE